MWPPGEPVGRFHVGRRDHLPRLDELAEPGSHRLERLDRDVADPVALARPVAVAERVGRGLEHDAHHVLALGRERRIGERRDRRLEHRRLAHVPVLHRVHRPLHVVDRRTEHDPAGEPLGVAAVERRQSRQREVHPRGRARLADVARAPHHRGAERHRVAEGRGPLGVGSRDDQRRVELGAVGEGDADRARAAVPDLRPPRRRFGPGRRARWRPAPTRRPVRRCPRRGTRPCRPHRRRCPPSR